MDGVILADKPAGRTSHDVVHEVRRRLSEEAGFKVKVGHAGTLDPFATGLLCVLVGRATRVQRWVMGTRKTYVARARFGFLSSTGDPDGEVVATGRVPSAPLALPTGVLLQRPPAYSAIKVGGRRAYALARAGVSVELEPREVVVHRFEQLGPDEFLIECSAGTYVRTLIAELGDAYCTALRRTHVGPFSVDDAALERVLPLGDVLAALLPVVELTGDEARRATHGVPVPAPAGLLADEVYVRGTDGRPISICSRTTQGTLTSAVGFR